MYILEDIGKELTGEGGIQQGSFSWAFPSGEVQVNFGFVCSEWVLASELAISSDF